MAAVKKSKPKAVKAKSSVLSRQPQAEFPPAEGAKPGVCRVKGCQNEVGPKSTLCATHRALLARKRDRALFLAIKATEEGRALIEKAIKKGAVSHLGL